MSITDIHLPGKSTKKDQPGTLVKRLHRKKVFFMLCGAGFLPVSYWLVNHSPLFVSTLKCIQLVQPFSPTPCVEITAK
ncbi:hypothetical protein FJB87_02150 [Salmonella enterica subsp. enterica]|uniref:hypothetical protein n=1 Tax=Salmonella enterica TaxID=28901 RepID=UPI0015FF4699|nr:hypothetical protein [Salmonella enterica]EBG6922882.1 hypothetical protein [Salmonella enterica subsp. enterica]ECB7382888.1 hypothetical protein [Salmonella enterica subsp. enterica serovar Brandenburg]ECN6005671.1 hypothetical protein [Salmonella enterica subsp. enterica serovar Brandenburg]EIS1578260.1 hypothetical protein [Salmonella enterica subsp. enterica serovar Brandenburg]ELA5057203.1 hypothetical protein [Salmonella enterica subsp. enterica serovar Brandenburg]